jgi:hypothetical protein
LRDRAAAAVFREDRAHSQSAPCSLRPKLSSLGAMWPLEDARDSPRGYCPDRKLVRRPV